MSESIPVAPASCLVPFAGAMLSKQPLSPRNVGMPADSGDVARLFELHGPMVYGRARRLLGSHEDAQEATQEVFVRVITGAGRMPPPGELIAWLSRITTNYCLNKLRDASRRRQLLDTQRGPEGEGPSSAGPDLLAQARALLADADERQAQAAVYVYIDGMSHDEAAEMLGVSRRTVGNLLERFTAWVREQEA